MKQARPGRFIAFLLTLAMVFSLCGVTAFAAGDYGIWINTGAVGSIQNTQVSDANAIDILGDGTVSYDAATNTLTLNNANLSFSNTGNSIIYVPNNKDLTIKLVGNNTLTASQCIFVTGNLTITGEGSLTTEGGSYGVFASKDLVIDGAVVESTTTSGAAIQSQQTVTIKNDATVNGASSSTWGIYGDDGIVIEGGSNVTATSTASQCFPAMMAANTGNIVISDSTVTATSNNDAGIVATNGNVTITNSNVKATSEYPGEFDQENDECWGIYAIGGNDISISGGTVTANSTGKYANAISAWGTLNISNNAVVTAEAGDSASYPSIFAENGVTISGSQVTAVSGGDAGIFTPGSVSITGGSDVDASGYWPAIRGNAGVTMNGSTVVAESSNDVAIFSPQDVAITDSVVKATGKDGANGIKANDTASSTGSWITTSGNETFEGQITNSVLINGTTGTVVGDAVIPGDVTLPAGTTLTVPSGASLTVPVSVTFTNHGTINGEGDITNNGTVDCDSHSGGTATCTQKAVCSVCGQEYGDLLAHSLTKTETKPATCTEAGYEAYWTCSACNKLFSDENGTTEIQEPVEIAVISHSYGADWKSDENDHWKECADCGEKTATASHTFQWITDKEATATEKGSKHEECSVCGYAKAAVEIPATGSTETPSQPDPDKDTPQTGDNGNVALWFSLLALSAAGAGATLVISRKRSFCGKRVK